MPKANADRSAAQNHYETLGVDNSASPDVIRTAYRALARKHHPDVNPSKASALRMAQINGAYQTLNDAMRRAAYDHELEADSNRRSQRARDDHSRAATTQRVVLAPINWRRRNAKFAACLVLGIVLVASARYFWLAADGRTDEFSLEPSLSPAPATDEGINSAQLTAAGLADTTCTDHPLACPAGSQHHAKLEHDACSQWCSDPKGTVVARSTTTVAQQLAASPNLEAPVKTEQYWNGRLACTYRFGLASSCRWQGSMVELGKVTALVTNDWQVTKVRGSAPAKPGAPCEVAVFPFEPDASRDDRTRPPYNCRVAVRCGGALTYGSVQSGYSLCDVRQDRVRGALDGRGMGEDGDPAMVLNLSQGQMAIADSGWRMLLTRRPR